MLTAIADGLEPPTSGLGNQRSVQLSYATVIMSHRKQIASPSIAPDQPLTIDDPRNAVSESKAAVDRLNVSLRASTLAMQDFAATLHAMGPLDCATRAREGFGPAPL